jgi:hypothetical protein
VPFDDDIGLDVDAVAEHAFQRRAAAVDGGPHAIDECPAAPVLWQFHVLFGDNVVAPMEQVLCRWQQCAAGLPAATRRPLWRELGHKSCN